MIPTRRSSLPEHAAIYASLQHALKRRAIGYLLTGGPGGLLVSMWALGAAGFVVLLDMPWLILPLTVAAIAIGVLMLRTCIHDLAVIARFVPAVVRDLYPAPAVSDRAIRGQLEHGQRLFAEIALKVIEITRGERDPGRAFLIGQAGEMVILQHDVARQAAEFARILDIVGQTRAGPATLLAANTAALGREAEQAAARIAESIQQMQTLLLQITQLGVQAADLVRTAESTRQARESLEHMQAEVSTRHAVADRVIADLASPMPTTRTSADHLAKGHNACTEEESGSSQPSPCSLA